VTGSPVGPRVVGAGLGGYAMIFDSEVMMESRAERHPTELVPMHERADGTLERARTRGRGGDSRLNALIGDATLIAKLMRGYYFTLPAAPRLTVVG
jgi:hypothetical protein